MNIMTKFNFRKDWETINGFTYEEVINRVTNIFAVWEKRNLIITYGRRERTTSDIYGLPYTSSGAFASLGCNCNVNAALKNDRNYVIYELAITENNEVVAYLTDADENEKYIMIGRL